jgi:hypothetical protein
MRILLLVYEVLFAPFLFTPNFSETQLARKKSRGVFRYRHLKIVTVSLLGLDAV